MLAPPDFGTFCVLAVGAEAVGAEEPERLWRAAWSDKLTTNRLGKGERSGKAKDWRAVLDRPYGYVKVSDFWRDMAGVSAISGSRQPSRLAAHPELHEAEPQLRSSGSSPLLFALTEPISPEVSEVLAEGLEEWAVNLRQPHVSPVSERRLAAAAVALGGDPCRELAVDPAIVVPDWELNIIRRLILLGADPLGAAFSAVRSPAFRRTQGATYTPFLIVRSMIEWGKRSGQPVRVVDPGTGSGRFLLAAGRAFEEASLIGVETDPLAALVARANIVTAGLSDRAQVVLQDYRSVRLPGVEGPTMFVGNPPYVRHHLLEPEWKEWLTKEASARGYAASQLAGLHAHFYLATLLKARPGDYGAFITSAEWLDVNYGRLVRELLANGLHAESITVLNPTARPFPDAAATAAVATFRVGSPAKHVYFGRVDSLAELGALDAGQPIPRERLATERRWSNLTDAQRLAPLGYVELGEICRVHRGSVTGMNSLWIAGAHSTGLPASLLRPTVTRAREIIEAGEQLLDAGRLKRVIDLPDDLDSLDEAERRAVAAFLEFARSRGAHEGYVARNRRAWWAVNLRSPAPIVSTYMARRPPAFTLNPAGARLLNIAHGLYPREPLPGAALQTLRRYLSETVRTSDGRSYAGGLVKFEPKELERVMAPGPDMLRAGVTTIGGY